MEESVSLRDNVYELGSEPFAFPRPLDQPREVEHLDGYESPAINTRRVAWFVFEAEFSANTERLHLADPYIGFLCCEWIGRDLSCARGGRVEERGLAGICLADDAYPDQLRITDSAVGLTLYYSSWISSRVAWFGVFVKGGTRENRPLPGGRYEKECLEKGSTQGPIGFYLSLRRRTVYR